MALHTKSPKGIIAVGIFLFFAAIMAFLAGMMLVWRGTTLDRSLSENNLESDDYNLEHSHASIM